MFQSLDMDFWVEEDKAMHLPQQKKLPPKQLSCKEEPGCFSTKKESPGAAARRRSSKFFDTLAVFDEEEAVIKAEQAEERRRAKLTQQQELEARRAAQRRAHGHAAQLREEQFMLSRGQRVLQREEVLREQVAQARMQKAKALAQMLAQHDQFQSQAVAQVESEAEARRRRALEKERKRQEFEAAQAEARRQQALEEERMREEARELAERASEAARAALELEAKKAEFLARNRSEEDVMKERRLAEQKLEKARQEEQARIQAEIQAREEERLEKEKRRLSAMSKLPLERKGSDDWWRPFNVDSQVERWYETDNVHWSKPDWVSEGTRASLKPTTRRDDQGTLTVAEWMETRPSLRSVGTGLLAVTDQQPHQREVEWEKPEWAKSKPKLKSRKSPVLGHLGAPTALEREIMQKTKAARQARKQAELEVIHLKEEEEKLTRERLENFKKQDVEEEEYNKAETEFMDRMGLDRDLSDEEEDDEAIAQRRSTDAWVARVMAEQANVKKVVSGSKEEPKQQVEQQQGADNEDGDEDDEEAVARRRSTEAWAARVMAEQAKEKAKKAPFEERVAAGQCGTTEREAPLSEAKANPSEEEANSRAEATDWKHKEQEEIVANIVTLRMQAVKTRKQLEEQKETESPKKRSSSKIKRESERCKQVLALSQQMRRRSDLFEKLADLQSKRMRAMNRSRGAQRRSF